MDVKEYRKQVERQLAASLRATERRASAPSDLTVAGLLVTQSNPPLGERLASTLKSRALDREIVTLLAKLKNRRLAAPTRLAAFQKLATATFLGERFAPFRPAYLETMRDLLREPQAPPELRSKAVSVLASEKDPKAQELLKDGLVEPSAALVPAPAALALLSLDDHSNVASVARTVFDTAPDLDTREAALRALSMHPASEDLLASVAADKTEARDLRAMGAAALQCLNPERFSALARSIIFDDDDFDDIRATSVTALANQPEQHVRPDDGELRKKIGALAADEAKPDLSKAAQRLVESDGDPEPDVRVR